MAAFVYRAVDGAGKAQRGVVEAASAAGARRQLRDRALLPVSVEPGGTSAAPGTRELPWRRRRIGARALATATRQLATLIGSDIAVEEALRLAGEQAETTRLRSLLLQLRGAILDGRSLAAALALHPEAFPDYYRASIAAGEQSGQLAQVLLHLADFVENRQRGAQKVTLALLYPALLAVVSFGMITMMMIYVVPNVVRVFQSHGADLPFLTRLLIALSDFVRLFGWLVALAAAGAFVLVTRWLAVPANRLRLDAALATRRPLARVVRQFAAARFAATLGQLVESAVPLVDALTAAAATISNRHIRARALDVAVRVREGSTLAAAMRDSAVFPAMLVAIVASGEAGGRLGPSVSRAAQELEREMDALTATVVALVEPAVLLLMGMLVLLMVLAILLPIINLNNLVAQ